MEPKTTTYVEYLMPGIFFPEVEIQEVQSRDPYAVHPGQNVYAFTFFDIVTTEVEGVPLSSGRLNESKRFYVGGEVIDPKSLPEKDDYRILRANLSGYDHTILCRLGNWQPFFDGDTVLDPALFEPVKDNQEG